jgi:hypothetical protein
MPGNSIAPIAESPSKSRMDPKGMPIPRHFRSLRWRSGFWLGGVRTWPTPSLALSAPLVEQRENRRHGSKEALQWSWWFGPSAFGLALPCHGSCYCLPSFTPSGDWQAGNLFVGNAEESSFPRTPQPAQNSGTIITSDPAFRVGPAAEGNLFALPLCQVTAAPRPLPMRTAERLENASGV